MNGVYKLDGIPSDLLNSAKEWFRRFKTETMRRQDVEIFNGNKFQNYEEHTLSSNQTHNAMVFITPTDKDIVLSDIRMNCSGGDTALVIFENPVYTGGTTGQPKKVNRQSEKLSTLTMKSDPVVSSTGEEFKRFKIYGSSTGSSSSTISSAESSDFYPLKRNTPYLFQLVNSSPDSSKCFCNVQWYELNL